MAKKRKVDFNYMIQDITMLIASTIFGIIVTPWIKEILTGGELKEDPYYLIIWVVLLIILLWVHYAIKVRALNFSKRRKKVGL